MELTRMSEYMIDMTMTEHVAQNLRAVGYEQGDT